MMLLAELLVAAALIAAMIWLRNFAERSARRQHLRDRVRAGNCGDHDTCGQKTTGTCAERMPRNPATKGNANHAP